MTHKKNMQAYREELKKRLSRKSISETKTSGIREECAFAGKRMGSKLRSFGDIICENMRKEEKIAFWSAVLNELADVFDDPIPDDAHSTTRH